MNIGDAINGLGDAISGSTSVHSTTTTVNTPVVPPSPPGMSTGAKIAIAAVAGLALITTVIIIMKKSK